MLLEVGFVDSGKGTGDDERAAVESRLKGGVLSSGSFSVVLSGAEDGQRSSAYALDHERVDL